MTDFQELVFKMSLYCKLPNKLEDQGILIRNKHFVYTSGRHGAAYFNKDKIYADPILTSDICNKMSMYLDNNPIPDTVCGAEKGGIILSQWVAYYLSTHNVYNVNSVYAEKTLTEETDRGLVFKRGYADYIKNKKVVIVEDVINTGVTTERLIKAVRELHGQVDTVLAICNRGGITAEDLGVKDLFCLFSLPLESYSAEECPLCKSGVAITRMK